MLEGSGHGSSAMGTGGLILLWRLVVQSAGCQLSGL